MKDIAERLHVWREHPAVMVRELFGVEPDPWQEEALEAYPPNPRMVMKACKGPGKLQPKSLVMETPTGPRRWGDLKPGDLVFGPDGWPTEILRTFENGVVPIYRVSFDDGSSTRVGAEHLWKVRGERERRHGIDWIVIPTSEIIRRRVRVKNGRWSGRQWEIPRQEAVNFYTTITAFDPYVAGVWLGDGSKGEPSYCKPYVEIEQEINRRGYATHRGKDGKQVRILKAQREFSLAFGSVFQCTSPQRHIPDQFKYTTAEHRRALLCGLMDTDGCIGTDSHMEFASTSLRLAEDVVWLVRSLGGVALIKDAVKQGWYYNENREKVECRDCYRVTVTLPFNPFRIEHKAERWHSPQPRYLTRYIDRIEPDGEEDSMCIEVAHPSGCYLTNDFIVTHNTTVLSWIAWNFLLTRPRPKCAATSISGANLKDNFWTEMAKWRNRAPFLQRTFEWTQTRIFCRAHSEEWFMSARTWPQSADANRQADTLAGLHADYILFIVDESGAVPDSVMVAADAALSSCKEGHIIQAGNPSMLSGPLWRACTTERKQWYIVEITGDPDDPKRSTRISKDWARQMIESHGRNNPWVLVNVFGQFPPSSINSLIGPDEVAQAMKRFYRPFEIGDAAKVMGVDVARYGNDSSVLARRQGIQIFPLDKKRNINSTQGAGWIARVWDDWEADACFVDATGGFGAGWCDQLENLGRTPFGVQYAGEPHDKRRYANKRTEMAFDFVEWIKKGGGIPEDAELAAALTTTTYTFWKDKLILEPKDDIKARLGYSPDEMDACMTTLAEPVIAAGSKRRQRTNRAAQAAYEPFADLDNAVRRSYGGPDYEPYKG